GDGLLVVRPVPGLDAGTRADPLVGGVDLLQDHLVGDHPDGAVAADAEDARVGSALRCLDLRHAHGSPDQALCSAMSSRAASRSSGVFRASVVTPGSARLARPVRVPPGHTSISVVVPSFSKVSMHRSQRTGLATWPTRRWSTSAPVSTACPSL